MAVWYDKAGDITFILDPREPAGRKLGFANLAWNECRIGAFVSAVHASGANDAYAADSVAVSNPNDMLMLGLKNSDFPDTLLGEADCDFWGISGKTGETTVLLGANDAGVGTEGSIKSSGATNFQVGRHSVGHGTTVNGADVANTAHSGPFFNTKAGTVASTNFAAFLGLRYVITNRGLASQAVQMWMSINNKAVTTTTTLSSLRTLLTNFTTHSNIQTAGSLTANDGVDAFPVPDAMYFRFPFINSRLRVHSAMGLFIN